MQLTIGTLALITSLLTARNSVVSAGATRVENHCRFTIWCASAKIDGTASANRALGGGGSATFQDIYNDNIGVSLKCADNAGLSHPFQMEGAISGGVAWYDLSALDGDPVPCPAPRGLLAQNQLSDRLQSG